MTVDEAMALLKEASDERDLDDFKKVSHCLLIGLP